MDFCFHYKGHIRDVVVAVGSGKAYIKVVVIHDGMTVLVP